MVKQNSKNSLNSLIGLALRIGVITSFIFILIGGLVYLSGHGQHQGNFVVFKDYTIPLGKMFNGISILDAKSLIQFGIIILIATPILRVVLSAVGFLIERDYLYTGITVLVLVIILASMISGYAG